MSELARQAVAYEDQPSLSASTLEQIRAQAEALPDPRSAVMRALYMAQAEHGWVCRKAMEQIAASLQMDPGYVEGVATFYTLYFKKPVGRHQFFLCTTLSCALRGAEELREHLLQQLEVKELGDTSADGLFTAFEVECLGCCEYAPVLRLDNEFHFDLTVDELDRLIEERRAQQVR